MCLSVCICVCACVCVCVCVCLCVRVSIYKINSESESLTQKRKIILENYSENKFLTICVNKRGANDIYVIWVKMSDLQKFLCIRN